MTNPGESQVEPPTHPDIHQYHDSDWDWRVLGGCGLEPGADGEAHVESADSGGSVDVSRPGEECAQNGLTGTSSLTNPSRNRLFRHQIFPRSHNNAATSNSTGCLYPAKPILPQPVRTVSERVLHHLLARLRLRIMGGVTVWLRHSYKCLGTVPAPSHAVL